MAQNALNHILVQEGILHLRPTKFCELFSIEGESINRMLSPTTLAFKPEQEVRVCRRDVEIQSTVSAQSFYSRDCFEGGSKPLKLIPNASDTTTKPKMSLPCGSISVVKHGSSQFWADKKAVHRDKQALVRRAPEGSLVLWSSSESGKPFDVYVDYKLQKHLRPHQVEGVKFLFDCLCKHENRRGAILADQMGLGKTLQSITVLTHHLSPRLS